MSFFGGANPNMMNGAFYQALVGQMQGGGQGGGMPSMQNMAPQIAQQQRQPISNISPVPNQQQQQQQQQPGGGIGAAVKGGQNLQTLYGMGKDGYNNLSGMFGSSATPPMGGNPNAMAGAPVANSPAGNSYLAQNPSMAANPGMAQGGMQGAGGMQGGTQPFFGGLSPSSGMYGPSGLAGMGQGGATGQMYGSMGATGQGIAGDASAATGTGVTGAAGAGADASSSSPSWLSQLWAML